MENAGHNSVALQAEGFQRMIRREYLLEERRRDCCARPDGSGLEFRRASQPAPGASWGVPGPALPPSSGGSAARLAPPLARRQRSLANVVRGVRVQLRSLTSQAEKNFWVRSFVLGGLKIFGRAGNFWARRGFSAVIESYASPIAHH